MEGRRNHRGENRRRSVPSRKPPRGGGKPTGRAWEKDFCKVVGSLDWETFLHMKKFTHLYSDVLNWDDSAGEEAFYNAKNRYWAQINGRPCDAPLPDPDLYIDKISWDSETDSELAADIESKLSISNTGEAGGHDPVVIFGDTLLPYTPVGWGDAAEDKNLDVPFNHSTPPNYLFGNQMLQPTGWGDCEENVQVPGNYPSTDYGNPWEQNWGNPLNNGSGATWMGYPENVWQFSGPTGYMSWGGNWREHGWGWAYGNDECNYGDGSGINAVPGVNLSSGGNEQGFWKESNVAIGGGTPSSHGGRRGHGRGRNRNNGSRNGNRGGHREQQPGSEKRLAPKTTDCVGQGAAAITVGQMWNQ
ncbi:uncharacterized protein LOC127264141 [Andrographis paniculata]|uniref:uncharacterized protein LOC127264141 n=1 Tax=Andrographis paniculata TaxID=175694 RepID=UPI0021E78782|nr:uncharacterized protein LOC127264141 [Andrographis paniculata]